MIGSTVDVCRRTFRSSYTIQFNKARPLYNHRQHTSTTTSIEIYSSAAIQQLNDSFYCNFYYQLPAILRLLQLRHQLLVPHQLPPSSIRIIYSDHPLSSHLLLIHLRVSFIHIISYHFNYIHI